MAFVLSNTVLCWRVFSMFRFTDTFIFVWSWYLSKLARIIIEATKRERHRKFFLWNENWYDFHCGSNQTLVFIYSILSFFFNSISQTGFSWLTWNYLPYCYFSTFCMLFLKTVSKLFLSINFCLQSVGIIVEPNETKTFEIVVLWSHRDDSLVLMTTQWLKKLQTQNRGKFHLQSQKAFLLFLFFAILHRLFISDFFSFSSQ
jgi:hypothetical protein